MITRKSEQTIDIREHMRGGEKQVEIRNLSAELPTKARLFGKLRLIPGASYRLTTTKTKPKCSTSCRAKAASATAKPGMT